MREKAKNNFLSDCYGRLFDITKRLYKVGSDAGTEDYFSVQHDFKRLQADFKELSAHHDHQDKDLQDFSRTMGKLGEIFTQVDPLISSLI
jgi:hypothetical protein